MTRRMQILAGVVLLVAIRGTAWAAEGAGSPPSFTTANIHIEQNATDEDYEVVIEVHAGDVGLTKLTIVAPNGRTVLNTTAPDSTGLGLRQFRFETPEPGALGSLQAAYPEGVYTFDGLTAGGVALNGTCTMSHTLPAKSGFILPRAGAAGVGTEDLEVSWTPVKGIAGYVLEIEQADLGISIVSKLPASISTFTVPDAVLRPSRKYSMGIATVAENGNTTYVETTFTTRK